MKLMRSRHHMREDEVEKDKNQMKRVDPPIEGTSETIEIDEMTEIVQKDTTTISDEMSIVHIEIRDRIKIKEEEKDMNAVHRIRNSYNPGLMMVLRNRRKNQMKW